MGAPASENGGTGSELVSSCEYGGCEFCGIDLGAYERFVVMAIKPKFSKQILDGEKMAELRRSNVRFPPGRSLALVYESSPTQAITGGFSVGEILRLPLDRLWEEVESLVPSDRSRFDTYFEGKEEGTAILIEDTFELPDPLDPRSMGNGQTLFTIPQQYTYVDQEAVSLLRRAK